MFQNGHNMPTLDILCRFGLPDELELCFNFKLQAELEVQVVCNAAHLTTITAAAPAALAAQVCTRVTQAQAPVCQWHNLPLAVNLWTPKSEPREHFKFEFCQCQPGGIALTATVPSASASAARSLARLQGQQCRLRLSSGA